MSISQISLLITGLIFLILSALLMFWYTSNQRNIKPHKEAGKNLDEGKWDGWMYKYKYSAIMYGSIITAIIAVGLLATAFI